MRASVFVVAATERKRFFHEVKIFAQKDYCPRFLLYRVLKERKTAPQKAGLFGVSISVFYPLVDEQADDASKHEPFTHLKYVPDCVSSALERQYELDDPYAV